MIDPDELMDELEAEGRYIQSLIQRSSEQSEDINTMRQELADLRETISSEQAEV